MSRSASSSLLSSVFLSMGHTQVSKYTGTESKPTVMTVFPAAAPPPSGIA